MDWLGSILPSFLYSPSSSQYKKRGCSPMQITGTVLI
jgi:hypothetical protein